MVKVFLTGATGYVGGEALYSICHSSTPIEKVTCLVRDASKEATICRAFPDIRIVHGTLDDVDLIEEESRKADVVFHLASTSHAASANAIARGLGNGNRTSPGYWIQISGASMFSGPEIKEGKYGQGSTSAYDDLEDTNEIRSIITGNPNRVVDNLVLSQQSSNIKTALVPGPLIYGQGRGPVNVRSIQAPEIARVTLQQGRGFRLGAGLSTWSNVHVHDLGSLFVALLHAAVKGKEGLWNEDGIYFPENGKMTFGELCTLIAQEAHTQGFISSATIDKEINAEQANSMTAHGAVLWGTNAVLASSRARKNLGWQPSQPTLADEIPEILRIEAARLGLASTA